MPIDPPEPIHDASLLSSLPSDPVWSDMSVTEPGTGTHLGVIKSRSTGAIYHLGPSNAGSGAVKWEMSTSLNSGAGGLLMTEATANLLINATSINGSGQVVSGGIAHTGRQQQYNATNPLSGTPLYTNLVTYKLV